MESRFISELRRSLKKLPQELALVQRQYPEAGVELWAMDEYRIGFGLILNFVLYFVCVVSGTVKWKVQVAPLAGFADVPAMICTIQAPGLSRSDRERWMTRGSVLPVVSLVLATC
jgi:hypothetical protein